MSVDGWLKIGRRFKRQHWPNVYKRTLGQQPFMHWTNVGNQTLVQYKLQHWANILPM